MKRTAFVLISVMIIGVTSFAQLPFTLGPKIGFNFSKVATDIKDVDDVKENTKTGFLIGGFMRANMGGMFYLQPEVYWTTKGGDITSSEYPWIPNSVFTQETRFGTVDIPVLIGIKLINFQTGNFCLMTGPVASFITSKNIDYKINGNTVQTVPGEADYKNIIWGLQAGAGVDIGNFTLDVRYEWGLNDISDVDDITYKSKLLKVSMGFKLF